MSSCIRKKILQTCVPHHVSKYALELLKTQFTTRESRLARSPSRCRDAERPGQRRCTWGVSRWRGRGPTAGTIEHCGAYDSCSSRLSEERKRSMKAKYSATWASSFAMVTPQHTCSCRSL